ncbi:unnamed protein product [Symbiodinium sp. CCMP2592]|nr:unnamed protein product [Symbiodinium sp. CCMP2592]
MASRMPSWRRTGARARESHFDGLKKGAWVEFPGYDNRGRQQGHLLAYLVEAGDDRQMRTGRLFECHVVAVQDGYYDYWVEQTYGAYTLDRVIPLHFCGSPQSSCGESTMYRHPIHVDVFRLLGMDQVLQVGWLTEEDKARAGAHPGLVGEAPGLGGPPPDPTADPTALGVQTGLPGVAGLAEALGASGQPGATEAAEQKKKEKEKKEKGDTKDELLAEIAKRSPAGRRERSALELTRGSSSKEKKRKRKSSSSDDDESSDSSFQLAALPKGVEKIREMHRRHPGRLASLTLQRCSELLAQAHGGVMASSERAKLPAVARGYFQLIYLTAHPAVEIGARNFKELSTIVAVIDAVAENDPLRALDILVQRLKAIELAHLQGNWTQAEQLELVKTGQWSAMFQQELKAAQQEVRTDWSLRQGPRRTPRWEGRTWTETAADDGGPGADGKATDGNNDKAPDNRPKGRGAKGKGKGKKGKATAGPRVRLEPLEIPILKRVLDSMPEEIGEQRSQIEGHLANSKVAALYKEVMSRVVTPKTEEEAAYQFAGTVIDNIDLPSETLLEILAQKFGVLVEHDGPQVSKAFAELFGLGVPVTFCRLLGRHNGVEIREYYPGWRGSDGGIYVGRGGGGLPCSVFQEPYYEQLVVGQVKEALDGRALYVHKGEEDTAYAAISTYVLGREAQPVWNEAVWKKWLGFWLLGRPTAGGPLGTFVRVLPCCAKEHFKQSPVELLPMALPKESPEMIRVMKVMLEAWGAHDLPSVALLNHLWAGSNHILGQGLLHPAAWTAAQKATGERLRGYAELFVEGKDGIEIGSWESLRQSLGDMYAGREVQKAYKLSWAAIAPHVPEPGDAGRISLAETVDPSLRPFVEDPELLRIPDQELGEAVTTASVLVESREEYDLIVSHLVEAGMLEREVPEETLHIRGEPVYNGMFGVHKGWQEQPDGTWLRTLRLIINLIPSNQVQARVPGQPSAHMGYSPIWGQIALLEDEVILCYAEDVRHCFHIFAPSPKWRGYFVIGKVAASSCFNDGRGSLNSRPRVKSAPMGWSNIVDFIQSSLERFGTLAGVPAERVVRMGEPAPLMPLSTPRDYHSFYVDNYDGFKVVAACDAGIYEGRPSDAQLQLREVFKVWNVGRDPKKAAEGTLAWSSLGAEQLGDRGLVGSARKLRWAVLGPTLRILCVEPGEPRGSQELLSVVGKAMHSVQFCRPLACLFDQLYREMSEGPGRMRVSIGAEDELLMIISSLPMHWMDQRARGRAKCHLLGSGDDLGGSCDPVLIIEVFGGMGGLRQACQLLGLQPQGLIYIDTSELGTKLVRRQCGYVLTYGDIKKITFEDVKGWRRSFPKVAKVIFGGGWPGCGSGLAAPSSSGGPAEMDGHLDMMIQLRNWLGQASKAVKLGPWEIVEIYENVVMKEEALDRMCSKLDAGVFFVEGAQLMRCRRPRMWWLRGLNLVTAGDMKLKPGKPTSMVFDTERPPLSTFLRPGCHKLDKENDAFFSFGRPEPKQVAPREAAIDDLDSRTLGRWKGDSWRLPPHHYVEANMVRGSSGVRRLQSDEQLRMLGFFSDHLTFKQKVTEDQKQQMISSSWPVVVAARLLVNLVLPLSEAGSRDLSAELWKVWEAGEARSQQLLQASWSAKFGPGSSGRVNVEHFRSLGVSHADLPVRLALDPDHRLSDEQFLAMLVGRNVSHKGTDVRLDMGLPFVASDFGRRSVDPTLWQWKVLLSYKWKQQGHITLLESVAVLDLMKKLTRTADVTNRKLILMVDNQGVVGILAKGRSSARMMQNPLRRITALQLASNVRLLATVPVAGSKRKPAVMPKRRAVLGKRTKEERKEERKALGALQSQVVAPKTESRYLVVVSRFLTFLIFHHKPYPSNFLILDREVSSFIEELWQDGDPKAYASDTLSGLGHFIPSVKPHLIASWRLHAAWGRSELPARAPPFTVALIYALAQMAFEAGWKDTAVLFLLGFHTFARSGELFAAKAGDFVLSRGKGTWTLPMSNSGQRQGAVESLTIDDTFVGTAISNFCKHKQPGDLLSQVSPGLQRKRLNDLLEKLAITAPYRWYSLRRGGATHEFRRSNNLASVCLRGRWSAVRTARIYLCDGLAQLSELQLQPGKLRQVQALATKARADYQSI